MSKIDMYAGNETKQNESLESRMRRGIFRALLQIYSGTELPSLKGIKV